MALRTLQHKTHGYLNLGQRRCVRLGTALSLLGAGAAIWLVSCKHKNPRPPGAKHCPFLHEEDLLDTCRLQAKE